MGSGRVRTLAIGSCPPQSLSMTHISAAWAAAESCPSTASGFTQPWATVTAAIIAVVGALIAFAGVTKTTRTTRQENRREEKVAILTEASVAINELTRAIDRAAQKEDQTARAELIKVMDAGPLKSLGDKYSLAETKLELYGFDAAAKEAQRLSDTLYPIWETLKHDPAVSVDLTKPHADYGKALKAIQTALKELP